MLLSSDFIHLHLSYFPGREKLGEGKSPAQDQTARPCSGKSFELAKPTGDFTLYCSGEDRSVHLSKRTREDIAAAPPCTQHFHLQTLRWVFLLL